MHSKIVKNNKNDRSWANFRNTKELLFFVCLNFFCRRFYDQTFQGRNLFKRLAAFNTYLDGFEVIRDNAVDGHLHSRSNEESGHVGVPLSIEALDAALSPQGPQYPPGARVLAAESVARVGLQFHLRLYSAYGYQSVSRKGICKHGIQRIRQWLRKKFFIFSVAW